MDYFFLFSIKNNYNIHRLNTVKNEKI